MSIKVSAYYWDRTDIKGNDKLCLLALADWCDDDGVCYPGYTALAEKCSVSRRTAIRLVDKLVENGELRSEKDAGKRGIGGTTNRYFLLDWRRNIGLEVVTQATPLDEKSSDITMSPLSKKSSDTVMSPLGGTIKNKVVTNSTLSGDTAMSPDPSLNRHLLGESDGEGSSQQNGGEEPRPQKGTNSNGTTPTVTGINGRSTHDESYVDGLLREHYKAQPYGRIRGHWQVEELIEEHINLIDTYGREEYTRAFLAAVQYGDARYASHIQRQIARAQAQPAAQHTAEIYNQIPEL